MENKSLLSVCIITKNESRHIRECIKSVKFASEIIVVDSGSSDDTANIAAGLGVTVFENAFEDFASQKNYAVSKANHDWVLSLDADERVTDQLRKEIEFKIQNSACSAYRIKRTSYIFGK
ncbi:MAG: glycosyltransferase family 2 protein, partial [Candidatus Omnitrophica bacterium]|nr:glycosyltransferase family 2 protein [Candidatus Omnitrophota bacterium]